MRDDLFSQNKKEQLAKNSPLAARMRPRTLEEYIGQEHILGTGRLLRRAIQIDQLTSLIFYGPPGTGKTTLAKVIAGATKSFFIAINAVLSGVKEIREAIETAEATLSTQGLKTVLFVDEVHRFNKSQQDALLPHVESGLLTLIGATTENPYFEVNKALLSRSRIFELKSLEAPDLEKVLEATLKDSERGYGKLNISLSPEAKAHLISTSNGDARSLLNALELAVETTQPNAAGLIAISLQVAEESIQKRAVLYDKDGDAHYDIISAFIKSVRGSDVDAALYWMAKMIYAGEDPRFIFRRMIILASEDVGLADPQALAVVMAASQAYDYVGMPEGRFHLSQACLYLATAPKSNSTLSFFDALKAVEKEKRVEVPNPLKDGNRDGDDFGHGKGYLYPHSFREHWVAQDYLPPELKGRIFYHPGSLGFEGKILPQVEEKRELQIALALDTQTQGEAHFLERTLSESSDHLRSQRKQFYQLAGDLRDQLILIQEGDNGLLFWEGLRLNKNLVFHLQLKRDQNEALLRSRIPPEVLESKYLFLKSNAALIDDNNSHPYLYDQIWIQESKLKEASELDSILSRLRVNLTESGFVILSQRSTTYSQKLSELPALAESPYLSLLQEGERLLPDESFLVSHQTTDMKQKQAVLECEVLTHHFEQYFSPKELEKWFWGANKSPLITALEKLVKPEKLQEVLADLKMRLEGKTHLLKQARVYLKLK